MRPRQAGTAVLIVVQSNQPHSWSLETLAQASGTTDLHEASFSYSNLQDQACQITFCWVSKWVTMRPKTSKLDFSWTSSWRSLVLTTCLCIGWNEFAIHQHVTWSRKINELVTAISPQQSHKHHNNNSYASFHQVLDYRILLYTTYYQN